jgi:acyl carrier protein
MSSVLDINHVSEKLKGVISAIMELDEPLNDSDSLVNDIGMASIDFVELIVAIEKEFGITIDNDAFSAPMTIRSLSDLLVQSVQTVEVS